MARQKLKWDNPKSFKTAVGRLAKSYNAYVHRGLPEEVLEDQLENIKRGLGYERVLATNSTGKTYYKNDPNKPLFESIFKINADGTLSVIESEKADKIYEAQANSNKVKVVAEDRKNAGKVVADKKLQTIREVYESTPTITEYIKNIRDDVSKGYSDNTPPHAELVKDTLKETVEEFKKRMPNLDENDVKSEAKSAFKAFNDAVLQEMIVRASFDKNNENDIGKLYNKVSEDIDNGLFSGDELNMLNAIVHHDGTRSTYADINILQGVYYHSNKGV